MKLLPPNQTEMLSKRNFWNSCPLRAGFFPDKACSLGKAVVDTKDHSKGCEWYINSERDNYCFWTWVRRVSDAEGFMEPLLQHEMSELLGTSSTKIHSMYKETLQKIRQFPEYQDLQDIFKD